MSFKRITTFALITSLISCAAPVVDNTPQHPTSVVTAKFTVNGLYVPDHKGTQTVYTREDKRTIAQQADFDSFYMSWADYDEDSIFRIDKNLIWQADNKRETYQECPLAGCKSAFDAFMEKTQDVSDEEDEYETYEEKGCQVTLDKNEFKVIETNNSRTIGNLPSKEYRVTWNLEFKDEKGKTDINLVQFVFWTTDPTAEMQESWKIHQKATENYLNKVGDNNPLVRLLGRDGFKAISAFSGDIEKTDQKQFNNFLDELTLIKGYPLSIKLEWFQKMEACAAEKTANKPARNLEFSGDIAESATDFFGGLLQDEADKAIDKMVDEWMKEVRVRYIYEVTSVSQGMIKDSKFEVPANYTLEDRQ